MLISKRTPYDEEIILDLENSLEEYIHINIFKSGDKKLFNMFLRWEDEKSCAVVGVDINHLIELGEYLQKIKNKKD